MPKIKIVKKSKPGPVERAIAAKERAIQKIESKKRIIMAEARSRCKGLDKKADQHRTLLNALVRGTLKP